MAGAASVDSMTAANRPTSDPAAASEPVAGTLSLAASVARLRAAAEAVIAVVDEPSPRDDGSVEVEALWYYEWEVRHRGAVDRLRAALGGSDDSVR